MTVGGGLRHLVLDRDGVLNREATEGWVTSVEAWDWERGTEEALAAVAGTGVRVSVVTNQSVVGRGLVPATEVEELHRWLAQELRDRGVDLVGIFACLHHPDAGCGCRKPAPGLVHQAIEASGVTRSASCLVGDDRRDLAAAEAAGIDAVLVRTGKGTGVEATGAAVPVFDHLGSAVAHLLGAGGPAEPDAG